MDGLKALTLLDKQISTISRIENLAIKILVLDLS